MDGRWLREGVKGEVVSHCNPACSSPSPFSKEGEEAGMGESTGSKLPLSTLCISAPATTERGGALANGSAIIIDGAGDSSGNLGAAVFQLGMFQVIPPIPPSPAPGTPFGGLYRELCAVLELESALLRFLSSVVYSAISSVRLSLTTESASAPASFLIPLTRCCRSSFSMCKPTVPTPLKLFLGKCCEQLGLVATVRTLPLRPSLLYW